MTKSRIRPTIVLGLVVVAVVASLSALGYAQPFPGLRESLGTAIAAQERHTDRLLALPDVVGTAVGLRADGQSVVKVYTRTAGIRGIPGGLQGVPVEVEVTGEFVALSTSTWPRPVPIGVSTGNRGECSAGTLGARLTWDGNGGTGRHALSNNHVYALENTAALGSEILQPGPYDTGCAFDPNNVIGTLAAYKPINFNCDCGLFCVCDSAKDNTIDAAIGLCSTDTVGKATPLNGYGTPRSATVSASVGQLVQKHGRTTELTKGKVDGINATVIVRYGSGYARFKDQIVVKARRVFIKPGDSGSLLVTDPSKNPVGLVYAGTSNGKTAIANRIDLVLTGLSAQSGQTLSIDGD